MAELVCYREECSILGCDKKNCSLRQIEYEKSDFMNDRTKKEFMERLEDGHWRILYDLENRWGAVVTKQQAEEAWSRYKQSGLTFKEWLDDWD